MVIGRPKDPEVLSTTPGQIRRRLRRTAKRGGADYQQDLELYAQHGGFKPVEDWDYEELAFGKPRNRNGDFRGRTPSWISPAVVREAKKRLVEHTNGMLGRHVELAIQTVVDLIKNEEVDDKGKPIIDGRTKLAAAQFIIEHVKGKATTIIEMDATDLVKQSIAAAIVLDDGQPQDEPVILQGDFEIIEDEEEETTDDE